MKDITHMASLLTYLEPVGNKFCLNISLLTQNTSLPEKNIFPSITINDSDPLARLIEARVVSDAGSEVKKLFLFVQRDSYTLKKNALWPFNNNDGRTSLSSCSQINSVRKVKYCLSLPFSIVKQQKYFFIRPVQNADEFCSNVKMIAFLERQDYIPFQLH
jgi:hypothetical protein